MLRNKVSIHYSIAVLATMGLGLATRAFTEHLPAFVADHFGDALWACMIYFGIRVISFKHSKWLSAGFALLFCFGIEFSQLYQADWINAWRNSRIGALVLGRGFLLVDLARYGAGVAFSLALDRLTIGRKVRCK